MELTGTFSDYFIVFWGGVLVSFTPCVYPLLPLTAGFIAGINTDGGKLAGFGLSLLYVLGIAIAYSLLAVAASMSGVVFGQWQNSPIAFIVVAIVLILFALAMFDVFHIPTINLSFHHKIKTKNVWTIILFGLASALVIGPCTAPVLGTLLLYVASKQNMLHAVSLMFVFAYGLGTSLILVGTFTGLLKNMPKSGVWMTRIKQAGGIILLLAAAYFLFQATKLITVN